MTDCCVLQYIRFQPLLGGNESFSPEASERSQAGGVAAAQHTGGKKGHKAVSNTQRGSHVQATYRLIVQAARLKRRPQTAQMPVAAAHPSEEIPAIRLSSQVNCQQCQVWDLMRRCLGEEVSCEWIQIQRARQLARCAYRV